MFYFSDGSGAQYKNFKNFTNLLLHEQELDLKSEWHFFATSHEKNASDGVGGTIKGLAAHASLQRLISNQILTPLQLFEFANVEIHGVTSFLSAQNTLTKLPYSYNPDFRIHPSSMAIARTTNSFLLVTIYR